MYLRTDQKAVVGVTLIHCLEVLLEKGMTDAAQVMRDELREGGYVDFVVAMSDSRMVFWLPENRPVSQVVEALRRFADAMESGQARRVQ